jgi:tetrahydromethanopterin S-methyltransferase subunit G
MNVNNLNLVELNAKDAKDTNGGDFGIVSGIVVGIVVGAAVQIMSDWENFEAGLAGTKPVKH